tara:strand:+ start:4319 stop:4870 length:552 start_codon:yes stop_codon:yes gene_type:complete
MDDIVLSIEKKLNNVIENITKIHVRLDSFEEKINKLNYLICESPTNKKDQINTTFEVITNEEKNKELNNKNENEDEDENTKKNKSKRQSRQTRKTNFDYNNKKSIKKNTITCILNINKDKISRSDFKLALLEYLNNKLIFTNDQIEKLDIDNFFINMNLQPDKIFKYYEFERLVSEIFKTIIK